LAGKLNTIGQEDECDVPVLYKNEYSMPGLPAFVKKIIILLTYHRPVAGKYKKFKDAPVLL
jgi:hypothetical protein